ncbi:MAG: methionyl-tRNA formyltransferase [Sulfurimonadaceae bacterium]
MINIVIATVKEWNIKNYFPLVEKYKNQFNFHLISNPDELTEESISVMNPKYIFFPHWSWIIPKSIYSNYDCVVFHMTDLPFGRGGSPFQNLIMEEIYDTKVSALKVDEGLDTGDIYIKEPLNISVGSAEENFIKLSSIIFQNMIPKLLDNEIVPVKQTGKVTIFKRRTPDQSNISLLETKSISKLYDFIRMLDAEGYPKAYLELDGIRIEFSEVNLKNNTLDGRFEVIENE